MNGAAQLAIVAGLAEEFLDDLRDEVRPTMPKPPEPLRIDCGLLADFVMTGSSRGSACLRNEPRGSKPRSPS